MEQTYNQRTKKYFPISLFVIVLSLLFITLITPLKSFSKGLYVDFDGEGEVTITKHDNTVQVEGDGSSGFVVSTIPLQPKDQSKSICEKNEILSIKESNNALLGTVTSIGDGTYLTARHVFAGKNPATVKKSNNSSQSVFQKFKRYFQFVDSRTNKPLDLLLMVDSEDISLDTVKENLLRLVDLKSPIGRKWSSCQYGIHDGDKTFSQFSEGIIRLASDDLLNLYLGINHSNENKELKRTDLTTFGSSGASIWTDSLENSNLVGVVSCLQTFSDNNSSGKLIFPRIISLKNVLNFEAFYLEETTLEKLRRNPQEKEPYCTFTDGKGGGGFFTSNSTDNKKEISPTDKRFDTLKNENLKSYPVEKKPTQQTFKMSERLSWK